ncbi:MAG TPA: SH3 domain-containing protein, partial [Chitinophagaceae bacterium]|nr:SH3 domain-containing protein [Chitinophagaceae bacterium]
MDFASIIVPAAAVRRKPRHQSEMTNQLLFGESVKILKEKDELWVKVRSLHDGYEGWLTRHLIGKAEESALDTAGSFVTGGLLNTIDI